MELRLDDRYTIETDNYNFTLLELKTHKEGKNVGETYKDAVGYYGNLTQLIQGLIHHDIKKSSVTSIQELIDHIDKLVIQVEANLKDVIDILGD